PLGGAQQRAVLRRHAAGHARGDRQVPAAALTWRVAHARRSGDSRGARDPGPCRLTYRALELRAYVVAAPGKLLPVVQAPAPGTGGSSCSFSPSKPSRSFAHSTTKPAARPEACASRAPPTASRT